MGMNGYIAGENRFFYLMGFIDVYDRVLFEHHIGLTCECSHAAHILERITRLCDITPDFGGRTDGGLLYGAQVGFPKAMDYTIV